MSDRSIRGQVRDWWNERWGDTPKEIDYKADIKRIVAHFEQDENFRRRFFREAFAAYAAEVALSMLSQRRGQTQRAMRQQRDAPEPVASIAVEDVPAATRSLTRDDVATAFPPSPTWARWVEFDPTSGLRISLPDMTRKQLLAAAHFREERTVVDQRRAALLRLLAGRMNGEQCVRDVYSESEITEMESRIKLERQRFTLAPADWDRSRNSTPWKGGQS